MKGFFYLMLTSLLFSSAVHAQSDFPFERDNFISGTFQYMMPDEIGNVFALTNMGQLKKYNTNLDSMGVFNEVRRFGRLHSISANNPLRSLLYFKEYRTIILLDRLMQVINKVDLRKTGIFQVQAVAQSYDNKIWVFDEQESKIRKLDDEGRIIFSTADLRLVFTTPFSPTGMFDMGGYIYLYDPLQGLFIFDYYGALKNKVALLGWKDVQPMGKQVIGFRDNQLMIYTPGSIDLQEVKLPTELLLNTGIRFSSGGFFVLKQEGILRYKWK